VTSIPESDILHPGNEVPRVYLACKLTGLTASQRQILEVECDIIQRAAVEGAVDDREEPWELVVYTPLMYTAPWRTNHTPAQIWRCNSHHVLRLADGLIVHGIDGASFGVGNEATLAFGRGIPILYVHHHEQDVSRQTLGMAEDALNMTVRPFTDHVELAAVVRSWVREQRSDLQLGPTVRASLAQVWTPLQQELADAWSQVLHNGPLAKIGERCFIAGMGTGEITDTVAYPSLVAALPAMKLVRLGTALRVPIAPYLGRLRRLPDLNPDEEDALNAWCNGRFSDDFRQAVGTAARKWKQEGHQQAQQRAEAGVAARTEDTLDLTVPADWDRFYAMWRDGRPG
jgi:hypothetical protein